MEGTQGNLNFQGMGDQNANNQNASADARPAWTAQLPDALKENQTFGQFKTIGELGSKFLEYEGRVKNAVSIPGENATPEERTTFNQRMGVPASPDKYQFEKLELPEWYPNDENDEKNFRQWAFENGLPQKAAARLYKQLVTDGLEKAKEVQAILIEHRTKSENALKDLWKTDYTANHELANRGLETGVKRILGEESGTQLVKFLKDSHLADDPLFVQFFHGLGRIMDSDKTAFGTGFTSQGGDKDKYAKTDKYGNPQLDFNNTPTMKDSS